MGVVGSLFAIIILAVIVLIYFPLMKSLYERIKNHFNLDEKDDKDDE